MLAGRNDASCEEAGGPFDLLWINGYGLVLACCGFTALFTNEEQLRQSLG